MTKGFHDVAPAVSGRENGLPVRRLGLLFVALVSVSAYPALFVYFHNIREAVVAQIISPTFIFIAVGLTAWLFFGLLSAGMTRGALLALLFLLVFMNYALIEDSIRCLVPDWRWWRIAPAFLFLFINLALMLRVLVKRPEGDAACTKIALTIGGVFFALTLFNAARGIYTLAQTSGAAASPATRDAPAVEEPLPVSSGGKRPNFYFFIFDEYARADILIKYAGFDNTPFMHQLEHRKFNVSYSSYSSSSRTQISVGNSLNYAFKYKNRDNIIPNHISSPLFKIFKAAGYTTRSLSPVFQIEKDLVDVELQATTVLTALSVTQTVLRASFIDYLHEHGNEDIRSDRLRLLQQAAATAYEKTIKSKFLFFHFMCPHEPFVFNKNGGPVACEHISNSANPKYYIEQVIFLSKKIDALVGAILKKDPQAVILLQSDHGCRFFSAMQEHEKLACLNALYVGGQAVGIEGLSTINTLRLAMNHTLGLKLELLRDET